MNATTARYIGTCKACKTVHTAERSMVEGPVSGHLPFVLRVRCDHVGARASVVEMNRILGYVSAKKCDRRCTEAKGHSCDCSCGGKNHGQGHFQRNLAAA